jgi:hypothetical protein
MSSEWCDTDPHVAVVTEDSRINIQVIASCPTRAEANAAHKDMLVRATYLAEQRAVEVRVTGIQSYFQLRVRCGEDVFHGTREVYRPGERGWVTFTLPDGGRPDVR